MRESSGEEEVVLCLRITKGLFCSLTLPNLSHKNVVDTWHGKELASKCNFYVSRAHRALNQGSKNVEVLIVNTLDFAEHTVSCNE